MTITMEQIRSVTTNGKVYTQGGDKVGGVGQIYADDTSSVPTWVTVKTGLFGTAESFVPLEGATVDGDNVVVAYDKETIKNAPRITADGSLTPDEEQDLFRHYGLVSAHQARGRRDSDDDVARTSTPGTSSGHDAGPDTEGAMTRSEEQLRVGTQTEVTGRAVLRKYVVTEYVTQTIPVRHEEIRLEREEITEANRGELVDSAAAFDDDVYEVILHKEVPVVQTETVAVERVRLRKVSVTEQANVSEDLRKEKIEVDDPRGTRDDTSGERTLDR